MIAAILFGLDGTLIDTWDLYTEAYRYVVQPYVRKPLTATDIQTFRAIPEREFIKRCIPEKERDHAFSRFLMHYSNFHDSLFGGMYKGVREMLGQLRQRSYAIGIVTGKSRRAWEITAEKSPMGRFDVVITDDDVDYYKPNLECLQTAINELGIENSQTLYVSHTLNDYKMALEANVQFAAVLWSKNYEERAEFLRKIHHKKSTWLLNHPEELIKKLTGQP